MDNSFTLGSNEEADHVKILQSCNGLLLCSGSGSPAFYYVYNPSTNLFKMILQLENSHDDSHLHATGVLRMAFDPIKSRDYKVMQLFACSHSDLEIQVYSSETGNWSLCREREGSYDPMLEQIDIPGILHLQGRLFESPGCLLLACRDDIDSREFTIYEMVRGSSVWTIRRRKIPNLDPPAGIFEIHLRSLFECDFVSLDSRLNSKKPIIDHSFSSVEEVDHVRILQSCNGLLLCTGSAWPVFYYVYNPSTNLFKRLPQPNYSHDDLCFYSSDVFRMAFDARKSLYYKVVQAGRTSGETQIQIYSSYTGNWSLQLKHCKLNIEDYDHPIMTSLDIPHGLHRGRNFLESFGGPSNDPVLLLMEIPHMLHLEGKFFESRGCLLLVCRDDIGSIEFTIYKMMKRSSMWSVREEDAFVVINLSRKVVIHNLISKINNEIFDIGSNPTDDNDVEFMVTDIS
ncbi:hypothetical protein Tco_0122246 [Tanacetum coccineum]